MKNSLQNKIWLGYEYDTVHILFKKRAKRSIDIDMNHNSGYSGLCELEGNWLDIHKKLSRPISNYNNNN